ncbi:MAG TPA: hypothetical protein VFK26_09995 [Gemmatimonadaceae bacterium]|nr:hypothetical protein [Gemmatimonadaceae bacterium]
MRRESGARANQGVTEFKNLLVANLLVAAATSAQSRSPIRMP